MRRSIVVLAVIAAAAATGCASPDGVASFTGYHRVGDSLRIENLTIPDGRYRVDYSVRVQLLSRDPAVSVRCGVVDSNATVGYLEQALTEAGAGDGWVTLSSSNTYELPEVTLGIRCAPTLEGAFSLRVSDVSLTALPTADYR
jgi:hypothetical protein